MASIKVSVRTGSGHLGRPPGTFAWVFALGYHSPLALRDAGLHRVTGMRRSDGQSGRFWYCMSGKAHVVCKNVGMRAFSPEMSIEPRIG